MFSGIVRGLSPAVTAAVVTVVMLPAFTAAADPSQDQKFFDLLGQKDIPPVDGEDSLVTSAKHACAKLDSGMPAGDLVELIRNNGFNDNPLARFAPQDRITRTIDLFLNAAVEAYCPNNRGKIAGIAAYRVGEPSAVFPRVVLTSFVGTLPAGEIAPTNPLPVPAQPPPVPHEIQPVPEQPPPPPRHAPPAPKQAPPPPQEPAPLPEAPQQPPPEATPPAPASPGGGAGGGSAPAPAAPGGGAGGGSAPATQTPDQPAPPPGHIRLAP